MLDRKDDILDSLPQRLVQTLDINFERQDISQMISLKILLFNNAWSNYAYMLSFPLFI